MSTTVSLKQHLTNNATDNSLSTRYVCSWYKSKYRLFILTVLVLGVCSLTVNVFSYQPQLELVYDVDHDTIHRSRDILSQLYPTEKTRSQFNFTRYIAMDKIGGIQYFLERSLSLYPGNEGPILDLIFNKLILGSECIKIGLLGGSISGSQMPNTINDKLRVDVDHGYGHYLAVWLNAMFPRKRCRHEAYFIGHFGAGIDYFIGARFASVFLSRNATKYDIVIVEAATNNHADNTAKSVYFHLKQFELYYRHLLQIPYHPIIINLELTIHRGARIGWITSSHFIMSSILKYYQIVSLSMYDSLEILQIYHDEIQHKKYDKHQFGHIFDNNELQKGGYYVPSYDRTHPYFWGHQLIATVISHYLFKQYQKASKLFKTCDYNISHTQQTIATHYLFPNGLMPDPPLYIDQRDVQKLDLLNYMSVNVIVLSYSFELHKEKQINDYFEQLTQSNVLLSNIRNIPFHLESLTDYDYSQQRDKFGNWWHFGIESDLRKPGLIFYTKKSGYDYDDGELVLRIKLDLTQHVDDKCHLGLNYLKSYERMATALIWISDNDIFDTIENCTKDSILSKYSSNSTQVQIQIKEINALDVNDRTSQIHKFEMDLMNTMQPHNVQYLNICVKISDHSGSENKFKLTTITVICETS